MWTFLGKAWTRTLVNLVDFVIVAFKKFALVLVSIDGLDEIIIWRTLSVKDRRELALIAKELMVASWLLTVQCPPSTSELCIELKEIDLE